MEPVNAKKVLSEAIDKFFSFDKSMKIVKRYEGETRKKQGFCFVIEHNADRFMLHYGVHLFLAVDDRCKERNVEHRKLGNMLTKGRAKKRVKKHRAILEGKWEVPEDYLELDQRFRILLPEEAHLQPDKYIRAGDHVLANRIHIKVNQNIQGSLFIHEGIYMGNKMVINMNGDTLDPKLACVRYDPWDAFVSAFGGTGHLELWIYVLKRRSPQEVLEHAKARLGEGGYNLFTNNCQAFAQSCHSNKKYTLLDRIRYQRDDYNYDEDDPRPDDDDDDDSDSDTETTSSKKSKEKKHAKSVENVPTTSSVLTALVQHPVTPALPTTTTPAAGVAQPIPHPTTSTLTVPTSTMKKSSSSSDIHHHKETSVIDNAKAAASSFLQTSLVKDAKHTFTDAKQRLLNTLQPNTNKS